MEIRLHKHLFAVGIRNKLFHAWESQFKQNENCLVDFFVVFAGAAPDVPNFGLDSGKESERGERPKEEKGLLRCSSSSWTTLNSAFPSRGEIV